MIKSQSTLEYKQGLKQPIIVGVVTVLCLSLFVNKAFHLDDPLFIWTAKQINSHPADFYGFDLNWYGYVSRMSEVSQNPPLSCYYIAIVGAIFGYSEVVLHIAFLLPAAAVAIGTFFLAKRFCANPALAVFAGVLTPGFLVSSTNIMCDTMMLAFWVWAIYFWITGIEQNKKNNLFWSAILITLSALTKYFGVSLLPLLFVYTIFKKRGIGIWVLFFVIPILILAGYQWYTLAMYGRGLISNAAQYAIRVNPSIGPGWFARATSTGIYFTGGCIISVLFFLPLLKSKRNSTAFVILLVLFMLMPFLLNLTLNHLKDDPVVKIGFMIQAGLMGATGVLILYFAAVELWKFRNAEMLLLALWIFGTFVFASYVNWTVNSRSILPMIPAVGIVLMRQIELIPNLGIKLKLLPLLGSAILSLVFCAADYSWAGVSRNAAASITKNFYESNKTLWFEGHWGFQYYMQAMGNRPFDFQKPLVGQNEIIVIPANNTNIELLPENLVAPLELMTFQSMEFAATMNMRIGAGFYTSMWGPLPFAFGPIVPDNFYVYIVK